MTNASPIPQQVEQDLASLPFFREITRHDVKVILTRLRTELAALIDLNIALVQRDLPAEMLIARLTRERDAAKVSLETIRQERDALKHEIDEPDAPPPLYDAPPPSYDAEREARCLFQELLKPERTVDKVAKAMSFLRLWANSYLLNDNYWDVPQTMGSALNQVIAILEERLAAQETAGWQPIRDLVTKWRESAKEANRMRNTELVVRSSDLAGLIEQEACDIRHADELEALLPAPPAAQDGTP